VGLQVVDVRGCKKESLHPRCTYFFSGKRPKLSGIPVFPYFLSFLKNEPIPMKSVPMKFLYDPY
jgi:hypothetical protein